MSVYNGDSYLEEQLESILHQAPAPPDVLVRDDGSTDCTREILNTYAHRHPGRVTVLSGRNLGAAQSFLELIFAAPTDYDYYALSDADDVWLPDKIANQIRAVCGLAVGSGGRAIVSRMEIVDQDLGHLGFSQRPPRAFTFSNALVQTIFNGAASLLDRRAMEIVQEERPRFVTMHDSWLYLVLSARGTIGFSPQVALKYRQHGSNVFGVRPNRRTQMLRRWQRICGQDLEREAMIREFARIHGRSSPPEVAQSLRLYLDRYQSFRARTVYVLQPGMRMQRLRADLFHRLLVAIGRS